MPANATSMEPSSFRERGEIPHLFYHGVSKLIVNRLPEHVSPEEKKQILDSHPDPDICFQSVIRYENKRAIVIPENVESADRDAYQIGAVLLNEIAAKSIVLEVLGDRIDVAGADKKLSGGMESAIDSFVQIPGFEMSDKTVGFFQHLQTAYLNGEKNELNDYLEKNYGYKDFEEFSVDLGKAVLLGQDSAEPITGKHLLQMGLMSLDNPGKVIIDVTFLNVKAQSAFLTALGAAMAVYGGLKLDQAVFSREELAAKILLGTGASIAVIGSLMLRNLGKEVLVSTIGVGTEGVVSYLATDFENKRTGLIQYE